MESFPENLVMNRGEAYRALQEERFIKIIMAVQIVILLCLGAHLDSL